MPRVGAENTRYRGLFGPGVDARTPARDRQRRFRQRRREGTLVVAVEVRREGLDELLRRGWIGQREVDDPRELGSALTDLLECLLDGRLSLEPWPTAADPDEPETKPEDRRCA